MPKKPKILKERLVAESQLFQIEQVDLRFSNGELRCFERIRGRRPGAVLIIPVLDDETLLLVREYAVGSNRYELGFPKGLLEDGENPEDAANREMMEEIGYGANDIRAIKTMSTAPGYMVSHITVILARDLYQKALPGDEPEDLEVVPWRITDCDELLNHEEFSEARSIAAFLLAREVLLHSKK